MSRLRLFLALSVAALALLPAAAQAQPRVPGFHATFPHAAKLCAKSDRGRLPAKLRDSAAEVAADCVALHASFAADRATFVQTAKPLVRQARTAVRTAVKACRQGRRHHVPGACAQARRTAVATLKGLRAQLRTAVATYRTSVRADRSTFWTAIRALPGGAAQPADTGTPPAPTADVPADAAVA